MAASVDNRQFGHLDQSNGLVVHGIAKPFANDRPSDSAVMDGIRGKQLLMASEIFLSIAVGGLLAVNHRLQECTAYAAAMYVLMTLGVFLLGLFVCRWKQGSATASATHFGYEPAKKTFTTLGKLLLCVATGGLLFVPTKPMDQFPNFAAAMILLYLLLTVGILLLWRSMLLPPLGYAGAATASDDS